MDEGVGPTLNDIVGVDDATLSGSPLWVKDNTRPIPGDPVQQTIDISGLAFTDILFYKPMMSGIPEHIDRTFALNEITIDFDDGGGGPPAPSQMLIGNMLKDGMLNRGTGQMKIPEQMV